MKKWFTSDWHLGEEPARNTHSFLRPKNFNIGLPDNLIWPDYNEITEFYFLGDMAVDLPNLELGCRWIRDKLPNTCLHFVYGDKETNNKNFRAEQAKEIIDKYFDHHGYVDYLTTMLEDNMVTINLVHKPEDISNNAFHNVVGHIHGTKRIERLPNTRLFINVGIDAWCFQIVPEDWITHQIIAGTRFYDENIFLYS